MSSAPFDKGVSPEKLSNEDPEDVEKASKDPQVFEENPEDFDEDPQVFGHGFDDHEDYTDMTHKEVWFYFHKIRFKMIVIKYTRFLKIKYF